VTDRTLPYRTRNLRALDFDFTVETDHAGLAQYLDSAFAALETSGDASHVVTLSTGGPDSDAEVTIDDRTPNIVADAAHVLPALMSAVNRAVVEATASRLLVHASAVEADGRAILFPAPMEAGKSTLAAALLRRGYRYVTDEAVALDPDTLEVRPYPRPINVDRGSWSLLRDLRPAIPNGVEEFCSEQWHVSPLDVRRDALARPSPPVVVAFPRYAAEKRTRAQPMGVAHALQELVGCAFNLDRLGVPAFGALARVASTSRCYRLTVGDLGRACTTVDRLVKARGDELEPAPEVVVEEPDAGGSRGSAEPAADPRAVGARFAAARRPGLAWVILDRVVVYDPRTGRVFRLNASGSLLWQVLDGEAPLRDLAAEIASAFGRDRGVVEYEVVTLARRLARLGLIARGR
jgi:Coenzyme PQQ synthesis protein D (PqqD)